MCPRPNDFKTRCGHGSKRCVHACVHARARACVYLSIHVIVCPCPRVRASVRPCVRASVRPCARAPVRLCVCVCVCVCVCLTDSLSVCIYVCMSPELVRLVRLTNPSAFICLISPVMIRASQSAQAGRLLQTLVSHTAVAFVLFSLPPQVPPAPQRLVPMSPTCTPDADSCPQ